MMEVNLALDGSDSYALDPVGDVSNIRLPLHDHLPWTMLKNKSEELMLEMI